MFDGTDVLQDKLIQQAGLMRGERFIASGKAVTLEQGQFMGQLIGAGFVEPDFTILTLNTLQQLGGQDAQLLRCKLIEGRVRCHTDHCATLTATDRSAYRGIVRSYGNFWCMETG